MSGQTELVLERTSGISVMKKPTHMAQGIVRYKATAENVKEMAISLLGVFPLCTWK